MTARSGIPIGAPTDLPTPFSITVEAQRDEVRIAPSGELDIASAGQLRAELERVIDARPARIVIDLRGVEFLDSTGLHALIRAHTQAQRHSWELSIIPGPPPVQRIFELTGTIGRLPFSASNGRDGIPEARRPGPIRSVTRVDPF